MYKLTRIIKPSISNIVKSRTLKSICINGFDETIYQKEDNRINDCLNRINNETVAVLGYGPQGRGQSLNLRDNGVDTIIGVRKGKSWDLALQDGWIENKTLFSMEEATYKANIIKYLLSDSAQMNYWPILKSNLREGNTLYFSHGFGITYNDLTKINPPDNVDVIMVAPKGCGMSVRDEYLKGGGINVSFAIHQDYSKKAKDKCLALAFLIGANNAFETTFEKEVYSDLTGERSVLLGLIQGAFSAQYKVLRENGHSPSEAYNETVEEALISLYPIIRDNGMDWLYHNCSTTAQRGALDWCTKFENVLKPVIEDCYKEVKNGNEARRVLKSNSSPTYRIELEKELKEIDNQELWKTAKVMRHLR
jgi:ketol-acid reductoisomerase